MCNGSDVKRWRLVALIDEEVSGRDDLRSCLGQGQCAEDNCDKEGDYLRQPTAYWWEREPKGGSMAIHAQGIRIKASRAAYSPSTSGIRSGPWPQKQFYSTLWLRADVRAGHRSSASKIHRHRVDS